MVRVISQETFDAVVAENKDDLGMEAHEAVKEAVEQFKAQGVDLSNIVVPSGPDGGHPVLRLLTRLVELNEEEEDKEGAADAEEVAKTCLEMAAELQKGLPERVLATQNDGYSALVSCFARFGGDGHVAVRTNAMQALANLLDGNPDPLDAEGFKVLLLGMRSPERTLSSATLECVLNCCVRHEHNRQNLVRNGLLEHLDANFEQDPLRVTRIWQALVQDDDVRVPFGQAHENARAVVEEHGALGKLAQRLRDLGAGGGAGDEDGGLTLTLSCLSSLSVRNEFCQAVAVQEDGVRAVMALLANPDQTKPVVRESLRLLKTLAGNDDVKREIREKGGLQLIVNSINKNMSSKPVCFYGCSAVTAVCLRSTDNAGAVVAAGGAQTLAQVLKTHQDTAKLMTACCNAIRNVVSRSSDLAAAFVALDVEELINSVMSRHPSCADSARAALRDLGLKVDLKEEWKGQVGGPEVK